MLDQRLVCFYTDDTGQKTKGRYLLLAGLAISDERDRIAIKLEEAETASGKGTADWHSSSLKRRTNYLEMALEIPQLRGRIFYRSSANAPVSQHIALRTDGIQAAIVQYANRNKRAIYHEGITRANRDALYYALRNRGLVCQVRNAKQARYPQIRLADALAGMIAKVKFASDGDEYRHLMPDWFIEL